MSKFDEMLRDCKELEIVQKWFYDEKENIPLFIRMEGSYCGFVLREHTGDMNKEPLCKWHVYEFEGRYLGVSLACNWDGEVGIEDYGYILEFAEMLPKTIRTFELA